MIQLKGFVDPNNARKMSKLKKIHLWVKASIS